MWKLKLFFILSVPFFITSCVTFHSGDVLTKGSYKKQVNKADESSLKKVFVKYHIQWLPNPNELKNQVELDRSNLAKITEMISAIEKVTLVKSASEADEVWEFQETFNDRGVVGLSFLSLFTGFLIPYWDTKSTSEMHAKVYSNKTKNYIHKIHLVQSFTSVNHILLIVLVPFTWNAGEETSESLYGRSILELLNGG